MSCAYSNCNPSINSMNSTHQATHVKCLIKNYTLHDACLPPTPPHSTPHTNTDTKQCLNKSKVIPGMQLHVSSSSAPVVDCSPSRALAAQMLLQLRAAPILLQQSSSAAATALHQAAVGRNCTAASAVVHCKCCCNHSQPQAVACTAELQSPVVGRSCGAAICTPLHCTAEVC